MAHSGKWIGAGLLLAGAAIPAMADEQPAGAPARAQSIETVVVTARKQSETVHDAPLTVSVVTPEAMKALNVTSAYDLNGAVPS
jgi:iron complex outermembrane recepter protein